MALSLSSLLSTQTKEQIYQLGLSVATALGLPVTSWSAGDPTRSTYHFLSEIGETFEEIGGAFIGAGFLDEAEGAHLVYFAEQQYGVIVPEATYATCDLLLVNTGGNVYNEDENDVTVSNPETAATYRNTAAIALSSAIETTIAAASDGLILPQASINVESTADFPASGTFVVGEIVDDSFVGTGDRAPVIVTYTGKTATTFTGCSGGTGYELHEFDAVHGSYDVVTVEAEEAGSDGSSAVGEINSLTTALLGVVVYNTTIAVGADAPSDDEVRDLCRESLAAKSPNGPKDAYSYFIKQVVAGARVRTYPDSDTGDVLIYVAGPAGAITADERDDAEEAVLANATPLCITPTVASASAVAIPVTYELWLYSSVSQTATEVQDAVSAALTTMLGARPIGGDIIPPALTGSIYQSMIVSTIRNVYPNHVFRVTVSAPAGDTALTNTQVATLGTVTPTINFVADP
jgi:hypothetical protein